MTNAMKKAAVGTPDFEYGGYTIEEYERIFAYKKEGTMPSFDEVEESKRKGKRSTFRHKCVDFHISADGTSLMYFKTNKYDSKKKPTNQTLGRTSSSTSLTKANLRPTIHHQQRTSLSPPTFQLTSIQIISNTLNNDVITNRDMRFKPPTKGYMIINSSPIDRPLSQNIRKNIADRNCLFRAFSFCLTGSESHHLTVRRVLCDYMEFYPSTWQPLVGACTVSEYLDRGMRTSGIGREHWGTEIEILAFADMFNCMIYVYNAHNSARNIKQYEGYGPRPRADRPATNNADLTTFLLYNAHDHFEVVLSP
uniref:OTU domain-containing protein n=1 Tax=Plectus sambesii TaxID=2011161 RepID=A0A914UNQ7_9BILA